MGKGRPQQPELNRSGTTPLQPDSIESELEARRHERTGPGDEAKGVPEDNRPGHHPVHEQDKPDVEAFLERFSNPGPSASNGNGNGNGNGHRDQTEDDTDGPSEGSEANPFIDLIDDFADRVRHRDVLAVVTFPVHAGVRIIRHYRAIGLTEAAE